MDAPDNRPPATRTRVGLIGIGLIGLEVARNLIANGIEVVGYRRSNIDPFVKLGGIAAGSCAEVLDGADIVLELLPSVAAFESVFNGSNSILNHVHSRTIIASLSTYPLEFKRHYAQRIENAGGVLLDCEISGTPMMVAKRQAVVFSSGDEVAARDIEAILEALAGRQFYLGSFGTASKMKLVANHLVAINNLATAEAMLLGVRAGLDPRQVVEVIGASAGASTMFTARAPMMAERRFTPAPGPLGTLEKYVDLVEAMAQSIDTATPLMDVAARCYRQALLAGRQDEDISVVYEVLEGMQRPSLERSATT